MNTHSLQILAGLTEHSKASNKRQQSLLKNPLNDWETGWFMEVPPAFNSALDIKINSGTINQGWTQSGCFAFKDGDVLYDVPPHYRKWADSLQHVRVGVQIKTALAAGQGDDGKRFPGSVIFNYFVHDGNGTQVEIRGSATMTQDEFVRFLIIGPMYEIKEKINQQLVLDLK